MGVTVQPCETDNGRDLRASSGMQRPQCQKQKAQDRTSDATYLWDLCEVASRQTDEEFPKRDSPGHESGPEASAAWDHNLDLRADRR